MSLERINVPRKVSLSLKTVKKANQALVFKIFGQVVHVEMLAYVQIPSSDGC